MEFKIICPDCGNSDFSTDVDAIECNSCGEIIETIDFDVEEIK